MADPTVSEFEHPRWAVKWGGGIEPGQAWDACTASPLLLKYIYEGKVPTSGRALVPGCGRGYDVTALANPDLYVLGLDIVEDAVRAAKSRLETLPDTAPPAAADSPTPWMALDRRCACKSNADFQTTSFFSLNTEDTAQLFDFVYDYTFLCALDPSIRVQWAKQMAKLIKHQGELLTLIFPIRPDDDEGPPFAVNLELYKELLEPVGFECLELDELPSELCHPGRDGVDKTGQFKGAKSGVGRWKKVWERNYF